MPFTIKDFLHLEIIDGGTVRSAKDIALHKPIDSISVIELPVEDFVHENELVLSTCIGCADDVTVFRNFVWDIYKSGAAALVISTGRYVKEIPPEVIKFADELQFPLLEIPWEIRFAGIIETVLLEINNIKHSNLKKFESLQKKLLTYFLDGTTLSDAAELIHREFGNKVVIVNTAGAIKGKSNHSDDLLNILEEPLKILTSGKNLNALKNYNCEDVYTVYKIRSKNIVHGYLYIKALDKNAENDLVKPNRNFVVRHIVSPISLWFDREQTIFETEMHHQDNFIWDLINADEENLAELLQQGKSLGYDLSLPYICMVGLVNNFETSYKDNRLEYNSYEQWKYNCIKALKQEVLRAGRSLKLQVMSTFQKERLIVFLEIKDKNVEALATKFLDVTEQRIKHLYPKLTISWGIGENIITSYCFNKGYVDAKISLEVCSKELKPGYRNLYHNPSIYRLLSLIYEHKDAQEITMNIIGKLVEYDNENGLDLLNTFKTYMENKGNVSQTARSLHLHRQSLLYRLKKIEEITTLNLDKADDTFLLELCVRLWEKQHDIMV